MNAVLDLADAWDRGFLDSGDFPDRNLGDKLLSEKTPFPEVYITENEDLDELTEKCEKSRERILGK